MPKRGLGEHLDAIYQELVFFNQATVQGEAYYVARPKETEVRSGDLTTAPKCFAAGTMISLPFGEKAAIEDLQIGQLVLAYDGDDSHGRARLHPKRVVRLFKNMTDVFLTLSNGAVVAPGHHF